MGIESATDLVEAAISDEKLLEGYRDGDLHSFAQLYSRYARPLYLYLRAMIRDSNEAEDAAQEIFIRLLDQDRSVTCGSVRTYLYAMARHLVVDRARRQTVRARTATCMLLVSRPNARDRNADLEDAVSQALLSLPEEQREVIILKIYANMTFAEIAALGDQSPGTVMSRYRYGLEKLARTLKKE